MKRVYKDNRISVFWGDCREVLSQAKDDSIDSIVTDPPYELNFMGKSWDSSGIAYDQKVWGECYRVLKPGGHLACFGGTRTFHRIACAIEDSGFEIRDSLAWLYGSGFPKSLDVSKAIDKMYGVKRKVVDTQQNWGVTKAVEGKQAYGDYNGSFDVTVSTSDDAKQWDGWGTALKPAFEPIILARKPFHDTVANNVLEYGTGAINVDGCRIRLKAIDLSDRKPSGRWPPNVVLDDAMAAELDKQSGIRPAGVFPGRSAKSPKFTGVTYNNGQVYDGKLDNEPLKMGDEGGASRFFPIFKYQAKAPKKERPSVNGINHPTVKPLQLIEWLITLITPPKGLCLDPFAGTGTTVEAALNCGFRCAAIELERNYIKLIKVRVDRFYAEGPPPIQVKRIKAKPKSAKKEIDEIKAYIAKLDAAIAKM